MNKNKNACVIGHPIHHSKSPHIHTHWLNQHGIDGSYTAIDIDPKDFDQTIDVLKNTYIGWNVTIPFKTAIIPHLDHLTSSAQSAGAVNTVYQDTNGHWVGDNTDIRGIELSLTHKTSKPCKSALILGAGGAARGCIIALKNLNIAPIFLSNRSKDNALTLQKDFPDIQIIEWNGVDQKIDQIDLLINATSCGLNNQTPLPFSFNGLNDHHCVLDIVYTPLETPLLKRAKEKGAQTIDGLWMLLYQATPGFEKWFDYKVSVDDTLRDKIEQLL